MFLFVLTIFVTIAATFAIWSQPIRVFRHRTIEGLSLSSMLLRLWCAGMWFTYGVVNMQFAQIAANGQSAAGTIIILTAFARFSKASMRGPVLATIAVVTAMVWIERTWGSTGVGAVSTGLSLAVMVPQAWKAWVEPGGEGVSILSQLFAMLCSVCWVLYGVMHRDVFVVSTATWSFVLTGFIAVRTHQGRIEGQPISMVGVSSDVLLQAA